MKKYEIYYFLSSRSPKQLIRAVVTHQVRYGPSNQRIQRWEEEII